MSQSDLYFLKEHPGFSLENDLEGLRVEIK